MVGLWGGYGGAMGGLSPPISFAPDFVAGAMAPDFVAGAMAPDFVAGAMAPDFVAGAMAPDFVRSKKKTNQRSLCLRKKLIHQ
jgi:hypothetical protein